MLYCTELSEEESDFELEYEVLSAGSADPWDDTEGGWVSANVPIATSGTSGAAEENPKAKESDAKSQLETVGGELQPSTSTSHLAGEIEKDEVAKSQETLEADRSSEPDNDTTYDFEDLEQLMSEIGNMRDTLRLLPDFQRREMAAKLAMKMAAMFGDCSGDEEDVTDRTNNLEI